jgi:hypothetical protein
VPAFRVADRLRDAADVDRMESLALCAVGLELLEALAVLDLTIVLYMSICTNV